MQRKCTIVLIVVLMSTIIIAAKEQDPSIETFQLPNQHPKTDNLQPKRLKPEPRKFIHSLPAAGNSIDSYLKYCEAVIHSLESELPRKSIFRSLFMDKVRLSSGYDKHVKFSYFDVLKNLPDQHY